MANGTRAKTDAVDARVLAMIKERTRLLNRMKTQTMALTKRQTKARIAQVKHQIIELESALLSLLKECPNRSRALDILCSIPGLGRVTAVAILIECPEIGTMGRKQIASLAGLAPPLGRLLRNRLPGNG